MFFLSSALSIAALSIAALSIAACALRCPQQHRRLRASTALFAKSAHAAALIYMYAPTNLLRAAHDAATHGPAVAECCLVPSPVITGDNHRMITGDNPCGAFRSAGDSQWQGNDSQCQGSVAA